MSGILDSLGLELDGLDIESILSGPAAKLTDVDTAVQLLKNPTELTELIGALGLPPMPAGLDGLAKIAPALSNASSLIPADVTSPLSPILTPINGLLNQTLGDNRAGQILAAVDLARKTMELITRHIARGASPLSGAPAFWGAQGMPDDSGFDFDRIEQAFTEMEQSLDALTEHLDASGLLALLEKAAPGWSKIKERWPAIPVLADVMETLETVVRWKAQTPSQLTASLSTTVSKTALLIGTPRTQVAAPVIAAAERAANARQHLADAESTLTPLLVGLAQKTRAGQRPIDREIRAVEQVAQELELLHNALDLDKGPLADATEIHADLELSLIRVVRALHGAIDAEVITDPVQKWIGKIPTVPASPMDDVVSAVEDLDLSMITDPISTVKDTVDEAVTTAENAMTTVEESFRSLLSPVVSAIETLFAEAKIPEIISALEQLPTTISEFVEDEIKPKLSTLQDAIDSAVSTVSGAVGHFKPEEIKAQLEAAVGQASGVLHTDDVKAAFEEVLDTLSSAVDALGGLDFSPAADESIELIAGIEEKVAAINPDKIPDAAKPLLKQAIKVVTDVDFQATVADPITDTANKAIVAGPGQILDQIESLLGQLREQLERFKPSAIVGDVLQKPFDKMIETLNGFKPSDLLSQVEDALSAMASKSNVVDADVLIGPLEELYETVTEATAKLSPDKLLEPVNKAIEEGIAYIFEVTGLDAAFEGLNDFMDQVQTVLGTMKKMEGILGRIATKLSNPGDMQSVITAAVDEAAARLDDVDLSALQSSFTTAAQAADSVSRERIAADVSLALRNAADQVPSALRGPQLDNLNRIIETFPLQVLKQAKPIPQNKRLISAIERLVKVGTSLKETVDPWHTQSTKLGETAGALFENLMPYERLSHLEGKSVFADFLDPPTTTPALKATVREALEDGLTLPLSVLHGLFAAIAPHVAGLADGLSQIIDALHTKADSILGEEGVGGVVGSLDDAADLLRNLDLSPLTGPLTELYNRLMTPLNVLNPEPLRQAVNAVTDALEDLLSLSTLVDAATVAEIDATYSEAVDKLAQLSPEELLTVSLDKLYEDLLDTVLPVVDLVGTLRELVNRAGVELSEEIIEQVGRVEVAFDKMLNALPLNGGGTGGSVSVSAGASVG